MFGHTTFAKETNPEDEKSPTSTGTYLPPHNYGVKDLTWYAECNLLRAIYDYNDNLSAPSASIVDAFHCSTIRDLRVSN